MIATLHSTTLIIHVPPRTPKATISQSPSQSPAEILLPTETPPP